MKFVCFPEDFEEIYSMTVEQAQALVVCGDPDLWCNAFGTSFLYGKASTESAEYLAQQAGSCTKRKQKGADCPIGALFP